MQCWWIQYQSIVTISVSPKIGVQIYHNPFEVSLGFFFFFKEIEK
jgi:hypothetical protein